MSRLLDILYGIVFGSTVVFDIVFFYIFIKELPSSFRTNRKRLGFELAIIAVGITYHIMWLLAYNYSKPKIPAFNLRFIMNHGMLCALIIFIIQAAVFAVIKFPAFRDMVAKKKELKREAVEMKEKVKRKKEYAFAKKFYEECKKRGVTPQNEHDFMLVAKKLEIDSIQEGQRLYQLGIDAIKEEKKEKVEEERQEEINKQKIEWENTKLVGTEKYLTKLNKEYASLSGDANEWEALAWANEHINDLYVHEHDRDKNWAVAGGIAEAIAGPAAGLATAISVQNENEQRRRDAAKREAEAVEHKSKADDCRKQAWEYQKKADRVKIEIDKIKGKIVDDTDMNGLFSLIEFGEWKLTKTPFGNIKAECKYDVKQPVTVVNQPASLDGSLKIALIYENRQVASGVFCPYGFGVTNLELVGFKSYSPVDSICGIRQNATLPDDLSSLTVKVTPIHMWKIEI